MEHDEMNDDTPSAAGAASESSTSAGPPEPPARPPEPPPADSGPGLAGQVAAGLALIVLGGALLALERLDGSPDHLFLILIGGVFTAGYFYKKAFGLLIPGGILIGLGAGLAYDDVYSDSLFLMDGESAAFGIGVGFLLIYAISLVYERVNRWWPLIPGGFLVIAGLPDFVWVDDVLEFWPVAVMAVGILLLFRGVVSRQREGETRRADR
jgi:hypothetical protein